MFFSSIKGINRLISKGMSNIYLKVTISKNWRSQNFDFLSLKSFLLIFLSFSVLGSSNSRRHWLLKLSVATQKLEVLDQDCVWLLDNFNFEKNYDVLKVKESMQFVEQKYKLE